MLKSIGKKINIYQSAIEEWHIVIYGSTNFDRKKTPMHWNIVEHTLQGDHLFRMEFISVCQTDCLSQYLVPT